MDTEQQEEKKDYSSLYVVREFVEDDRKFITASFLNGLYYGDSWFSTIPEKIFMDNYKLVITALINNPQVSVQVACLKDEADVILGYSILGNNFQTIHWVFVKKAWRKGGIGQSLTPKYPTTVTHLTKLGKVLLTKLTTAVFNPFL